jgi:DNA mismatch repair protein MutL
MPIRLLPPEVAARIAAGEVVEGPASAVKELVENALDAGASAITVELEAGGLELIRVSDDGHGIAAEDVSHLFQRHATSKLATDEELEGISTLGFRGEALHSLAAVASITLLTRRREEESGTYIEARESHVTRQEPRGAPGGTTVTVRQLFGSVPARRKFLRSPQAEGGRVQRGVALYVLAHPRVRFTLVNDGRTTLTAPGDGDPREAVRAVYGAATAQGLLEVSGEHDGVLVQGLVSPPDLHRANRSYITLLVNGRPIQSRSLGFAVAEAYQGLLPAGRSPIAVLSVSLPPAQVDVNVHPAKTEVRFRHESEVFGALQRSVREALMEQSPVHAVGPLTQQGLEPTKAGLISWPPARRGTGRPLEASATPASGQAEVRATPETMDESPAEPALMGLPGTLPALRVVGQVQETYIVAEGPQGVYLIDQHAAHECVLYERIREAASQRSPEVQGLLEPLVVELTVYQDELAATQRELLEAYGWRLEPFGERSYLVRGMPMVLTAKDPAQALTDLLDKTLSEEPSRSWEERLAASVSCHGAVRAGHLLSMPEMTEMVRLLEQTRQPHTCPHGRPTMVHLSTGHLEREFRRR